MRSASASHAHLSSVHVWPNWPGADLEVACLRSGVISSLVMVGHCHVGRCGGLSAKCRSTGGRACMKNLCERISATSLWEWTRPVGPCSAGTLETLQPCCHVATSHSFVFSIYSSAYFHFALRTTLLSWVCAVFHADLSVAPRSFHVADVQSLFHQGVAFG